MHAVVDVGTVHASVPGLRVGYMVVPEQLIDAFLAVRALVDAHPSSIAQAALVDFIGEGHLAAHIRRMRALYGERQAALIAAVRGRLGERLALAPSAAGMHLVGQLAPAVDDAVIARAAAAAGVEAPALSGYYQGAGDRARAAARLRRRGRGGDGAGGRPSRRGDRGRRRRAAPGLSRLQAPRRSPGRASRRGRPCIGFGEEGRPGCGLPPWRDRARCRRARSAAPARCRPPGRSPRRRWW